MKIKLAANLLKQGIMILLHVYQHTFSLLFGPCCRFSPSCSDYAFLSIRRFGVIQGTSLALKRLIKCHPFHCCGFDPVPDLVENTSKEN